MDTAMKESPYYNPTIFSKRCKIITLVFVAVIVLAIVFQSMSEMAAVGGVLLFVGICGVIVYMIGLTIAKGKMLHDKPKHMQEIIGNLNNTMFSPKEAELSMSPLGAYLVLKMIYVSPTPATNGQQMVMGGLPPQHAKAGGKRQQQQQQLANQQGILSLPPGFTQTEAQPMFNPYDASAQRFNNPQQQQFGPPIFS